MGFWPPEAGITTMVLSSFYHHLWVEMHLQVQSWFVKGLWTTDNLQYLLGTILLNFLTNQQLG